ncbi:SDR family oxidoreductase [Maribacter polysiphoniae]|uniref:NAD(P)H dehydrogenase (Quinone) n=1 Tax=Maribacter polysiphoniae TaxID=429344 RepID=A0A316E1Z5_9FLAO|nr:SDR family oxidoreductase [Maribacter polysiphoniae]MBD1260829.1 SDR family oxidoreductase [Maribacter polysiphoniae]PWK24036.1 NAD(P)H dehydrogenase (quinone) [Maribacter polysiphoniae]
MKIAVTSASGHLGSAIVRQLIKEIGKENVIGIARTPEKAHRLGIEIREGDYNNREHFNKALQGIDAVLLVSGMDDPQKRIQQHRNVIEAAKLNGVHKIVYTSIIGDENKTAFSPVVQSNRQTERDIQESGLAWVIGRNGIYIEPDLEYIDQYVKAGEIRNCAGIGKCAYTSREELGYAYAQMLLHEKHNGQVYNLVGEPITQENLAKLINQAYGTSLSYNPVSVEAYAEDRKEELGEFMGTIITGIYEGIKNGSNDVPSDFETAAGRPHKFPMEMIELFKNR